MVVAALRVNAPSVLVTLLPNVTFAAPDVVNVEPLPFFVYGPLNISDPVDALMIQFRAVAAVAPCNVVPPTENDPVPTVNVIAVVAAVGCAVKFPLTLNAAVPEKVIVIFAAATAGERFALPAESIAPVAMEILCTRAVVAIVFVIAPVTVRLALMVSVERSTFPYVSELIVVALPTIGSFVCVATVPI